MRRIPRILTIIVLFFPACLFSQGIRNVAATSVLSSGKWLKVAITADGVYRLDYSLLSQKGLDDPSNPRVFCNNSGQLSYYNDGTAGDDLKEIAIYTVPGSDGVFNEGDYLLFYGKGTHRWNFNQSSGEYEFLRHNYSDTAFYFITSGGQPKKIIPAEAVTAPPDYSSSQSDALFIHEVEFENILHSGRDWFQQITSPVQIKPSFPDLVATEKIKYSIRVAAKASSPTRFGFFEGATQKKTIYVQGLNLYNLTGVRAQITDSAGYFLPSSSTPSFEMRFYPEGQQGAVGWIDYIKLEARVNNVFTGTLRQISDKRSVAPGRVTEFSIRSQASDPFIWDVTDQYNVKQVQYSKNGEYLSYRAPTDSLRTYVIFTAANAQTPAIRSSAVPNQDLHSSSPADMVILSHPLFLSYAQKIADIHYSNSGLVSLIVTPEQVYNEFSGGIPDIAALRNFMRMKYLKQLGTQHPLKYLLLFGDGSFENKTPPPNNPNFIPTYQSKNSNVVVSSFTSDDFYGLLQDGEGEADGTEDIGIGRLPVSDTTEAGIMVSKIRKYLDPSGMGDWRNVVTLVADDEDGNAHMTDAEGLSQVVKDKAPDVNIEKIYLDAFRQVTTVNSQTYPDVNKAITNRINAGCLIFNYTGHANETNLASESIVTKDDINDWKNGGRLPLIITATCEFSRFDEAVVTYVDTRKFTEEPSAGETTLLNKDGGAIALMSTTRVVFSAPNYFLNRNIFSCAFDRDSSGNSMTLGDIIRIAKNNSGSGSNKRNFLLLGDPALKLAFPSHGRVVTDSINNIALPGPVDSLKALSVITVAGHVESPRGTLLSNFNGTVSPLVYDKENKIRTNANDGGPTMEFYMRNNLLFSGQTIAKDGRFRFSFIVPRDINYDFGNGKISYYAHNDTEDMNGNLSNIIIGGFSEAASADSSGPSIRLFMNDTLFRSGGMTDENPVLLALLHDKGGINTSGAGIGHDLTGFLDNDRNKSIVLNNYFINDFDDYSKGRISYYLTDLPAGKHTMTVKAWDNFNNSSEKSISFVVGRGENFVLRNLFNYPNPFTGETNITGELNRPGADLDITISIFNLAGKVIKLIHTRMPSTGYTLPPVNWNGKDDGGSKVAKGIYPYVVSVSTENGETARSSGRMIIL